MRGLALPGRGLLPCAGRAAWARPPVPISHAPQLLRTAAAASREYSDEERAENARHQAELFNRPEQVRVLGGRQPDHVQQRLREIVGAVPGLGPHSRVLDVGTGTGVLIPVLQERGVQDVLATDVADQMLAAVRDAFPGSSLGNEPAVRTWLGAVEDLPAFQGPFDAAFFNSVFGNILDQRRALLHAALLLKPGGHIVLSHPLGSRWLAGLRRKDPSMVPHPLPDRAALEQLTADLPLEVAGFRDEESLYIALLKVPEGYAFQAAPIAIEEEVVAGFGRGSRQMGVPTANLRPEGLFAGPLADLPLGVYFGWAQLQGGSGADGRVHKTVLNIGRRPSIEDGEARTVELHVLHSFQGDFYGRRLRAVLSGFLRPEMNFGSLDELVGRIRTDIGLAKKQLDLPQHACLAQHASFRQQ